MDAKKITDIAHRTALRSKFKDAPNRSEVYTFNERALMDFTRKINEAYAEEAERDARLKRELAMFKEAALNYLDKKALLGAPLRIEAVNDEQPNMDKAELFALYQNALDGLPVAELIGGWKASELSAYAKTLEEHSTLLMNLLAIIHKDTGEHTAKEGLKKSFNDAVASVVCARLTNAFSNG